MSLSSDPGLLALLRTTHTATVRATATDAAGVAWPLVVLGGSVTVDARRGVRRSVSLQVIDVDGSLAAGGYAGPVSPFGAEVQVWRGVLDPVTLTTPSNYEVLLGTFRITGADFEVGDDGAVLVSITGEDRAYAIAQTRFSANSAGSTSIEIPAGTPISSPSASSPGAMQQVLNALSGVPFPASTFASLPSIGTTINYKWPGSDPEENPWDTLSQLAQAAGYELYFDNAGLMQATVVPSLTGDPTWNYPQDESNVVLSASRSLTTEGILNGVVMTSQDGNSSGQGEAYDTSGTSPTNANSTFGKRPVRLDNPFVKDGSVASLAAGRLLNAYVGQPLRWTQVPNPAMDVRDRVRIVESRLSLDATALVDSITIPLDPDGVMSVEGRTP